jgi:LPXTG-site transpeptidase (sortase) family protein
MSALPKLVLAASTALLIGVGVAYASDPSGEPRSDLAGKEIRRTPGSTAAASAPVPKSVSLRSLPNNPFERSAPTSTSAGDAPTPTTVAAGLVPRAVPLRLSIPSLELVAPVTSVGIEPDKSMQIPGANEAGWYRFGPQPGDPQGSAVIAGHVDHAGQPGVFLELRRLEVGAEVLVTDTDGDRHRYEVTERYQVDKDELPAAELFRTTGDPTLTLITCGGKFSKAAHSYSDNIVVRAVPTPLIAADDDKRAK